MNIVIAVPTLSLGGAEKLAALQAEEFTKRGHKVTLLTLLDVPDFYDVKVNRVRLNLKETPFYKNPFAPFIRVYKTAKVLPGADIVISHMSVVACYGARVKKIPFIFAEHSNIYTRKLWPQKTFILRRAVSAVTLSERDAKLFESKKIKTKIIYNPALPPGVKEDKKPPFFGAHTVLAAGRLVKEKGFDLLAEAWSKVKNKKDFKLVIAGEGPERKNLPSGFLAGAQKDIGALYKYADIFVLSSRTEAFPLALCEAMSYGLPAIAFNVTGADIIVRDKKDGFLIERENTDSFAAALQILIDDDAKRKEMSASALEVKERFSLDKYINAWEDLLNTVTTGPQ